MKPLSFIVLFFYLSALLPSVQFSAAQQWVEPPQSSIVYSLAQQAAAASPAKHMMLSDDDDAIIVPLNSEAVVLVLSQTYSYLAAELYVFSPLPFFARGPPLALN